jgi:hypothetical protein
MQFGQASLQWPVAGDTLWRRELWQPDHHGREWRRLRGDSMIVDPVDGATGEWVTAAGRLPERRGLSTTHLWSGRQVPPRLTRQSHEADNIYAKGVS